MQKSPIKKLLIAAAAIIVVVVVAMNFYQPEQKGDITVVSWGGAYTKSQVEAYHKPWIQQTGNSITSVDYDGSFSAVKAQVSAGNVTWDIVDVEMSDAVRGCDEGLLEPIDHSTLPAGKDGTPATQDFIPKALQDCAVANIVWSTIYAYDTSKFPAGKGPKTIADFFDVEQFPGKRGIRKIAKANMEMALMADGVAPDQVYDLLATNAGVERALRKMESIKDHVVWWETGAQAPQLLADEEVVMTTAYNGRIFGAIAAENKPFEVVWDGQILDMDMWVIPKGAPNKDLAMDFLKFSTATEQLAAQASWISYGPARKSSGPYVTTYHNNPDLDMKPHMPTNPDNMKNALVNDFVFWADNADQLNERFNAWLAQ